MSPLTFISIAEESCLIHQLAAFALEQACLATLSWKDGANVAVNISPEQLGNGHLVPLLSRVLGKTGLEAHRLEIELREADLARGEDVRAELRAVQAMGVKVVLDGFGAGTSSLSLIRSFRFDGIKLDGAFVRAALHSAEAQAVFRMIAELGRSRGIPVIPQGIETWAQHQFAIEQGCAGFQGYLLGTPQPSPAYCASVMKLDERAAG